jgi:proteasome lid subunit RPN8/RPN11
MRVALPADLRAQILREAQVAHPRECCGLLVGIFDGDVARITALYPARNLSGDPDRFDIDPRDHIAAQKSARESASAIIGCYHSHPHGRAQPSQADLAGADEENFLWLIAAEDRLNAFVYFSGLFTGADWVMSDS